MNPNDAPQPGRTDQEIFDNGTAVLMVASPRSQTIEDWVQSVAKETGLRMDWRMIGGRGVVLVLGDRAAAVRGQTACIVAIERLKDAYMSCEYNWTKNPERTDVIYRALEIAE